MNNYRILEAENNIFLIPTLLQIPIKVEYIRNKFVPWVQETFKLETLLSSEMHDFHNVFFLENSLLKIFELNLWINIINRDDIDRLIS